jgi:hypothetical protein
MEKKIGLILITLSFLIASYLSVLDALTIDWPLFIPAFLVGIVGIAFVQLAKRKLAGETDRIASDLSAVEESLQNVVRLVADLDARKSEIHTYDMRHRIDELLLDDLDRFVNARESISHAYGLQTYADVMSHFAGGERYLNRVWSASADGYIDEVNAYITKAHEQFEIALGRILDLRGKANV